ncbi:MAG: ATP-binding protein [Sandaracinaceae bacterium]|nr:ATP-binding protein [Sandaracinaceae bacterium]
MNLFTAHLTGITSQLLPVRAVRAGRTVTVTLGDGPVTNDPESNRQRETRIRVKSALAANDTRVDVQVRSGKLHSASMDLAVAAAIYATEAGANDLPPTLFLGELALSGAVRPIRGVLPHLRVAKAQGIEHVLVPESQVREAAGLDLKVHPIADVSALLDYLVEGPIQYIVPTLNALPYHDPHVDFADVRGLHDAVHACTLSAATGYPILFEGPQGAGSTLLARRLPTILPDATAEEVLEIRTVQSASGMLGPDTHSARPFRAPHYTCSAAALFGGGPQGHQVPGEISRAAKGGPVSRRPPFASGRRRPSPPAARAQAHPEALPGP